MAIKEFIKSWEEYYKAMEALEAHKKDSLDPNVNAFAAETIRKKNEELGLNLQPDQNGEYSPKLVRRTLMTLGSVNREVALHDSDTNLEAILNEAGTEKLGKSLDFFQPAEESDAAKLHNEYLELSAPEKMLRSGKEKEVREYMQKGGLKKSIDMLKGILREYDEKNKLSEEDGKKKGAMAWFNILGYLVSSNIENAAGIFSKFAKEKQEELMKALGKGDELVNYVARNVKQQDERYRENFYNHFYALNAKRQEAEE